MSVRRSHFSSTSVQLLASALGCGILCCLPARPHNAEAAPGRLYLLAGTPTPNSPDSFPVSLYQVGKNQKLEVVREVAQQSDGLKVVREWGDVIFVVHLHANPQLVTVIHMDDPTRPDDVRLEFKSIYPDTGMTLVAAPKAKPNVLLLPWISDFGNPEHPVWEVASVSSALLQSQPRVTLGARGQYSALRYEGGTGGPEVVPPVSGVVVNGEVAFFLGQPVVIGVAPPTIRANGHRVYPLVVATSEKYFLVSIRSSTPRDKLGTSEDLFLHDRLENRWRTITIEGNWSECRLFEPWLATIVRMVNTDQKEGPGRQNERSAQSDRLPDVQQEYRNWAGRYYWLPGILTLQNLADGRKIRIVTGQEDSEILRADGDVVLYRVNDTIYQARIEGDQLKDTSVVVKDEDVPEIHWAFWSK